MTEGDERSSAIHLQAIFLTRSRIHAHEGGGAELDASGRQPIKVLTDIDERVVLLGERLRRFEAKVADGRSSVRDRCKGTSQ